MPQAALRERDDKVLSGTWMKARAGRSLIHHPKGSLWDFVCSGAALAAPLERRSIVEAEWNLWVPTQDYAAGPPRQAASVAAAAMGMASGFCVLASGHLRLGLKTCTWRLRVWPAAGASRSFCVSYPPA